MYTFYQKNVPKQNHSDSLDRADKTAQNSLVKWCRKVDQLVVSTLCFSQNWQVHAQTERRVSTRQILINVSKNNSKKKNRKHKY